jgi:hypothetical protein
MTKTEGDTKAKTVDKVPGGQVTSEHMARFLEAAKGDVEERDPAAVAMEIISRIVNADSIADVFEQSGATHARDYLDTPFTLLDVKFNESTVGTEGPAFYALLSGVNPDGEPVTITCGASQVLAQAWKLRDLGALPIDVILVESGKPTKAGFRVMWLEAVQSF